MNMCNHGRPHLIPVAVSMVVAMLALLAIPRGTRADSVCAQVRIEIIQNMTLERQAFDALLKINNGLDEAISNVNITLRFYDAARNEVTGTANANDTNAVFYYRISSLDGLTATTGGQVGAQQSAEAHWLIIPAPGAGGTNDAGQGYWVGADIDYYMLGRSDHVSVDPDYIVVRPMPMLELDYFLPRQVLGDDPFTTPIEPPIPFPLGVRVKNVGYGVANKLAIESAQPEIRDNVLNLLVGFRIEACDVQGAVSERTLRADFGTLSALSAKVARWSMTASLDGRFVSFTAAFTHSDDLGGRLTSLLRETRTHTLLKDVRCDLPGRDLVYDFLAEDGASLRLYESDGVETSVVNASAQAGLSFVERNEPYATYRLAIPTTTAMVYAQVPWPEGDQFRAVGAVRHDGKTMDSANVWVWKSREHETDPWNYWLSLFDAGGGGTYLVTLRRDVPEGNQAPVLAYIGSKVVSEGGQLGFLVEASDPDGTAPNIVAYNLPAGASFSNVIPGQAIFLWTPSVGQYGVYPVRFEASDGELSDWEIVRIYVGHSGEELCNGVPCSLKDWGVDIKELLADVDSGAATVRWDSAEGLLYQVYRAEEADGGTGGWHQVGGAVAGAGIRETMVDLGLGTNAGIWYYKVVLAGEDPQAGGKLWAVVRRMMEGNYVLWAQPVRTDGRMDGQLGALLARNLERADDGSGDWVYVLDESGLWRGLYVDEQGVLREADGSASTLELKAGQGVYVRRKNAAPGNWICSGPVGNDGTRTNVISAGWNLVGLSEGRSLSLTNAFAGLPPFGGSSDETADVIIRRDESGHWRRLMYVAGWGEPYDGHWLDLGSYQIAGGDEWVQPGEALYYLRRGPRGEVRF